MSKRKRKPRPEPETPIAISIPFASLTDNPYLSLPRPTYPQATGMTRAEVLVWYNQIRVQAGLLPIDSSGHIVRSE